MQLPELMTPLKEDIGPVDLFTGRSREMKYFLKWVDLVKREIGPSQCILARKRRGKTAFLQRFYNVLYTRGDEKIIPFYFRIPEQKTDFRAFTLQFYKTLITQYLSFKKRLTDPLDAGISLEVLEEMCAEDPVLAENVKQMRRLSAESIDLAWVKTRELGATISHKKDERIIQIIDEFQFMDQYIYDGREKKPLCGAYQSTGESKISPQIISGSYVGWLDSIIRKMVGRYTSFYMHALPDDESVATIYNYAHFYRCLVTSEDAAYIARLCHNDPFYISRIFQSPVREEHITPEVAREVMTYETRVGNEFGEISKMWGEYIFSAFKRINDVNAKKIVLYLAKNQDREFRRGELKDLLDLEINDMELEDRMEKLVKADIIGRGSSMSKYKGLGDDIFALVFRKIYEDEIAAVDASKIEEEFEQKYQTLKGKYSNAVGLAAEHKVRYYLGQVGPARLNAAELTLADTENLPDLGPFSTIRKRSEHWELNKRLEIDLYAEAAEPGRPNLAVEVKDWKRKVGAAQVTEYIAKKKLLEKRLPGATLFMLYSEHAFTRDQVDRLDAEGILACDATLLPGLDQC
ncbi:MAG: hypothetical protein QNK37_30315 [Acidobacteriota bacterium]|nr:hypothetical protein [Acidobacteriota bacterium]